MAEKYFLSEDEVHTRPYALLLKDVWWALRTKSGNLFKATITRYGADGRPDGETTAEAEFGWNRENFAKVNEKLDRIIKKLDA